MRRATNLPAGDAGGPDGTMASLSPAIGLPKFSGEGARVRRSARQTKIQETLEHRFGDRAAVVEHLCRAAAAVAAANRRVFWDQVFARESSKALRRGNLEEAARLLK